MNERERERERERETRLQKSISDFDVLMKCDIRINEIILRFHRVLFLI